MADALIKRSKVYEDDFFKPFNDGIKQVEANIDSLNTKIKNASSDINLVDKSDIDSINKFFKAVESNIKLISEQKTEVEKLTKAKQALTKAEIAIEKINQERLKTAKELEKVNQEAAKTSLARQKSRQQEIKVEQEGEKLIQQQIRTKRAEINEKKKAEAEAEKQAKALRDENSAYKQQTKLLAEVKRELKDLAVVGKDDPALRKRFDELDKSIRNAEEGVGEFGRSVAKYPQLINNVSASFGDLVKSIGPAALATAGIAASISAIGSAISEVQEINKQLGFTGTITGLAGEELDDLTAKVRSTAETFDKDYNEVLNASNNIAKVFKVSQEEALDIVNQGFIRGADAGDDFLRKVEEYPVQFREAGLSAQDFIDVAVQEVKGGIFDDKLLDSVKEAGLRLRELPKSTEDALAALFKSQTTEGKKAFDTFVKGVKDGSISTKDALTQVRDQIDKTKPNVQVLQTLTADLLGGPGEDIGGAKEALKQFDAAINSSNKELTDFQKTQEQQLKTSEELQKSQVQLTKTIAPYIKQLADFGKRVLTFIINGFVSFVNLLQDLPRLIQENIGEILLLGSAIGVAFSGTIIKKVASLTLQFNKLKKRILESSLVTKALGVVQTVYGTITGILTGKIKLATVAQRVFNTVAKANPIGLVITAVVSLIGVLAILAKSFNTASEAQKKLNEENKKFSDEKQKQTDKLISAIDEEDERLEALNASEAKRAEERLKNIDKAQKGFRRSIPVIGNEIEKLEAKQAFLNKTIENFSKRTKESTLASASSWLKYTGSVDAVAVTQDELNKTLEETKKGLKEQREALADAQKKDDKLNILRLKTQRELTNLEKKEQAERIANEAKSKEEQLNRYILSLQSQIAAEKRKILAINELNDDELDAEKKSLKNRKRLLDLETKLTLATKKGASLNEIKLAKETAEAEKRAFDEVLQENIYDRRIDDINKSFDKLQNDLDRNLAKSLTSEQEYAEESIAIEIDRLKSIIEARQAAGEDVSEELTKLAQKERELAVSIAKSDIDRINQNTQEQLQAEEKGLRERRVQALNALNTQLNDKELSDDKKKAAQEIADKAFLEDQIEVLEAQLNIINQARLKRKQIEDSFSEEEQEARKEFAKENVQTTAQEEEQILDIREKLAILQLTKSNDALEKQKSSLADYYEFANELADTFAELEKERSDKRIEQIDKEIAARESQVDRLKELATKENLDANESIAAERRRISALERERAREQAKQRIIEAGLAAFKTYSAEVESGKTPAKALVDTLKNITFLSSLAKSLPSFDKGSEYLTSNENVDGKGGFNAIVHTGEGVIKRDENKRRRDAGLGTISETIDLAIMAKRGGITPQVSNNIINIDNTESLSEMRKMNAYLKNMKYREDMEFDKITGVLTEIVKHATGKKEIRKSKVKKWS